MRRFVQLLVRCFGSYASYFNLLHCYLFIVIWMLGGNQIEMGTISLKITKQLCKCQLTPPFLCMLVKYTVIPKFNYAYLFVSLLAQ